MSTSSILSGLLIVVFTGNIISRVDGCNKLPVRAPYFECTHGNPPNYPPVRCDGHNDCGDWSDEANCDDCYGDPYYCRTARINPNWTIAEYKECGPESDASDCKCEGFRCRNRQCITTANIRCNGSGDCDDSSDEEDCDACSGNSFYCSNARKCITSNYKCNLNNDCGDWSDEKNCVCPKRRRFGLINRIVGGTIAYPHDWPYMVALVYGTFNSKTRPFCGGTILTTRHILTAAHCVVVYSAHQFNVRVGEHNFKSPSGISMEVSEIRLHEQYGHSPGNDIAILKLKEDITFNDKIKAVSLPPPIVDLIDRNATVIGWGATSYRGPKSDILRQVIVPIWSQERCANAYPWEIMPRVMCAGPIEGGRDSCQGDSGGPLLTKLHCNSTWYIVGVVSTGGECAKAGEPGIYTRVSEYRDWISIKLG